MPMMIDSDVDVVENFTNTILTSAWSEARANAMNRSSF